MVAIYSKHHFLVSLSAGLLLGIYLFDSLAWVGTTALYACLLGVGIDVDHFVIARYNRGDWSAVTQCLRNPARVFTNQQEIFDANDVRPAERVLSHLLISGGLLVVLWFIAPIWAFVSGVVLYLHLLSDAVADASSYYPDQSTH